ncbi:MAG: hypothetical protein DRG30_04215, partial [Epsilonproteobacteria bacterium]
MDKLFFSYGHDDYAKFVIKIKEYLEGEGYEVFFDSDKLHTGIVWDHRLEVAIGESRWVLFFVTPHSARRPDGYCLNEISMALEKKKTILPIMIKHNSLPLSIHRQQSMRMEFLHQKEGDAVERLFDEKMQELLSILTGEKSLSFDGIQSNILQELDPLSFDIDFSVHKRLVGREWIDKRITEWIEHHKDSRLLWITAEAGYGKSALSVHLASKHPDVIGVHFCRYNQPSRNDPQRFIKTLAYSFQSQIDGYLEEISGISTEGRDDMELFGLLITTPLKNLGARDREYLFIIDALDETLEDGEVGDKSMITMLSDDGFKSSLEEIKFVKIIIMSRPDERLKQFLSKLDP